MNRSRKEYSVSYFKTVEAIPPTLWKDLNCEDHVYLQPDYLRALESNNSQLTCYYAIVYNKAQEPLAFATLQILDFYLDSLDSDQGFLHTLSCFGRKLKILPKEKPLKILNVGNPFVSGEHGIFIKTNQNKRKILRQLSKSILKFSESSLNHSIDVFMMKDFLEHSLPISNELISLGYYAFNVEPNMKLKINQKWSSFDDYLAALKTRFRVKAKKALSLSKDLKVENITLQNFDSFLEPMTKLYFEVSSKASFNLEEFRLRTYRDLIETLGDQYILKSYSLNDELVGFLSGIINDKSLDAHFVGIDYDLNKSHGIYQRMLYDYIQIGIDKKLETINFGRTASEIKSSVGAIPEHLTVYIRHKKTITNKFLRLFLQRIQPTEFNQKFPFKQLTPAS